eukprot:Lithocolla_globosa_v1_NODE_2712_length_1896_cov_13.639326.p1 type:complete len:463 gc:universal NODE_2712_length_1896_cov_13.639326:1853-465(-)
MKRSLKEFKAGKLDSTCDYSGVNETHFYNTSERFLKFYWSGTELVTRLRESLSTCDPPGPVPEPPERSYDFNTGNLSKRYNSERESWELKRDIWSSRRQRMQDYDYAIQMVSYTAKHGTGGTAMHLAVGYEKIEDLRLMLQNGGDPEIKATGSFGFWDCGDESIESLTVLEYVRLKKWKDDFLRDEFLTLLLQTRKKVHEVDELATFLKLLGLDDELPKFRKENITMAEVCHLTEKELREDLKLGLGPTKRILLQAKKKTQEVDELATFLKSLRLEDELPKFRKEKLTMAEVWRLSERELREDLKLGLGPTKRILAKIKAEASPIDEWDLFVSYKWDFKKEVKQVVEYLEALGYRVWRDENQMVGHVDKRMMEGILGSDVFLLCSCAAYQESENCLKELTFALSKKKYVVHLKFEQDIPSLIQFKIGNPLYYDFAGGVNSGNLDMLAVGLQRANFHPRVSQK